MSFLTPEEEALWRKVTDSIRPLARDVVPQVTDAGGSDAPPRLPARPRPGPVPREALSRLVIGSRATGPTAGPAGARAPLPPSPETRWHGRLDGHWDRRLRKGEVEPDRTLDLHGYRLDGAWDAIDRTLERAIASGDRVVLLITGHRREGAPPVERGRIRAAVHDWLDVSRHADHIVAVRGAHRRHGGGGSLYVILRR